MAVEMLVPFVRALRESGPQIERESVERGLAILAAAGLDLAELADPEVRIPHRVGLMLLEDGIRITGDPAFALRAGAGAEPGDLGVFEYLAGSAADLRRAMLVASRYLPLLHDGAEIEMAEEGHYAFWRHRLLGDLPGPPGAHEYVVAAFMMSTQRMLGLHMAPSEVHFIHDAPAYANEYARVFRSPVRFGCDSNAIVFPRGALDLRMIGADDGLHAVLVRYAEELLGRLSKRHPFTRRIRALVREHLSDGPTLTTVAQAFHMSERSVRRRLASEGVTHSEIVDSVRREAAVELLGRQDLSISEVAFELGFAHRPAFHRAFKRWYGASPSRFRGQRAGNPFYRFYERGEARSR